MSVNASTCYEVTASNNVRFQYLFKNTWNEKLSSILQFPLDDILIR